MEPVILDSIFFIYSIMHIMIYDRKIWTQTLVLIEAEA